MERIKIIFGWAPFVLTALGLAFGIFLFIVAVCGNLPADWLVIPATVISILLGGYLAALLWKKRFSKEALQAGVGKLKIFLLALNTRRCMLFLLLMLLIGVEAYFVMPKWEFIKTGDNWYSYLKCNTINGQCFRATIRKNDDGNLFWESEMIRPKQ